jgi:hypothetical protein
MRGGWIVGLAMLGWGGILFGGTSKSMVQDTQPEMPRMRIQLGLTRPLQYPKLAYYKKLYGEPTVQPLFIIESLYVSNRYIQLGLGLGLNYLIANGKAGRLVSSGKSISVDNVKSDDNSPIRMSALTYRVFASATLYPFPNAGIGLGLWGGIEETYFGEARSNLDPANLEHIPVGRTGYAQGMVVGASLPIRIAGMGSHAIASMDIMRGHGIYVAPFYEVISHQDRKMLLLLRKTDSGMDFSRQSVGVFFMFELL